jgi:hypothetical protein
MTDPLRSDRTPVADDGQERGRDARIEEFLVAGLDHYFGEQYDLAINVWTRVLFIDRGHARARAYIERARGAIAERQRKGDELLHTGAVALDRGDASAARQLVTSAVEHGAPADEAMALIGRIDRLETAVQGSTPAHRRLSRYDAALGLQRIPRRGLSWQWIVAALVTGVVLGAGALALLVPGAIAWRPFGSPEPLAVSTLNAPLPVPTAGEIALSRARASYARGHLREALEALDRVPSGDLNREKADELVTLIQRQLLAASRSTAREKPIEPAPHP